MKLYLIRHGQTDWNLEGKIQGRTDIPLNQTGLEQAAMLAKGMEHRPVTRIFSSPLKRALQTAQIIGESRNAPVEIVEDLQEVDFGRWEGLTWEQARQQDPEIYKRWLLNPVEAAPPGGELQDEVRRRMGRAVRTLMERMDGDAAVVSHGAALAYLVEYLMRDHPLEREFIVENSSITTIEYQRITGDFILLQANDTAHLQN